MFNVLVQQSFTLFFLAGLGFVAIGLGKVSLRKTGAPFSSFGEQVFFCAGAGFAVISYSVFILGAFRLLYPALLYILLVVLAVLSLAGWRQSFRSLRMMHPAMLCGKRIKAFAAQPPPHVWDKAAAFLLTVTLFAGFLLVLTPETGKDALTYHLGVPKLFLKHHGFYFIEGNIFAGYPLHSEMLFLIGLFLQGDLLAKGMHFLVLLLIVLGMYQFVRLRMTANTFPLLSAVIFYSIPSVFITSSMAYNDLFVTYYSMAAVFAFINWSDRNEKGWLILCGIFSGLAIASKYTALLLPFLGCLGVLWAAHRRRTEPRKVIQILFLYLSFVVILGSPFYVKNWIMTGNPFYPFLYSIFGGKGWEPEQARSYDMLVQTLGMGRELIDYILLPWNVSVHAKMDSPQFDGILGPIFLLTLPFTLGIRKIELTSKTIMVYCAFTFMFWAGSAQQIRYLMPIFPFLAILVVFVLSYYHKRTIVFGVLTLLIIGCLAFNGYHITSHFLKIRPVGVVTGVENRDTFLSRILPSYSMFQFANVHLPGDSKIFLIYMKNLGFLCEHDFYSDSMFESYTMQKILSRSSTPDAVQRELKERGFTHIMYDENHIYGGISTFSPEEKSRFSAFQKERLSLVKNSGPFYLYRIQ